MTTSRMTGHISNPNIRRLYLWATLAMGALFGILTYLTPLYTDDLWYLDNTTGAPGSLERFFSTLSSCVDHWNFDTGRLSNVVAAPFLGFLPKWVYATIIGGFIAWILNAGLAVSRTRPASMLSACWIATVVFVFPWLDFMFGVIFSINYVWGIFWGITLAYSFEKGANNILLLALAYIAGWWHEGLSVVLLAGMGTYLILRRPVEGESWWKSLSKKEIIVVCGLMAGIITIFSMPAFRNQMGERESHLLKSVWWESAVNVLAWNCIFYLYAGFYALGLCVLRTRRIMMAERRQVFAILSGVLAAGAVSTLIYVVYFNGPRTGAFNQIMCALGLMYLLNVLYPRTEWRGAGMVANILIIAASIVNLSVAVKVEARLSREFHDVQELAEKATDENKTVFYDASPMHLGIDLLKPSYSALNTAFGLRGISLLPAALADFRFDAASPCGDSRSNLYLYNSKYLILKGVEPAERFDVELTLPDGSTLVSRTRTRPFTTPEGIAAVYILPHEQVLRNLDIRDARILD
ncbi:MAG: hypothetical protein K2M06_07255 [Muribaculaceae bacterium]|nr:hypothetical protein [Muribaculaceae bacterium]